MSRAAFPSPAGLPVALALAFLAAGLAPGPADAAAELVRNGLFAQGADDKPADWQTDAYAPGSATRFSWAADEPGVGTATIASSRPNDASWVQNVPVSPSTWYRISGWVKTEAVGEQAMGAYLSVAGTFDNSRELRGTQDWRSVALWVKTGPIETSLKIACRLGGYGSLNTGTAHFTGISVSAAGTPAPSGPWVYGGSPEKAEAAGFPWAQGAAVLVAVGVALGVWRYFLGPSTDSRR